MGSGSSIRYGSIASEFASSVHEFSHPLESLRSLRFAYNAQISQKRLHTFGKLQVPSLQCL